MTLKNWKKQLGRYAWVSKRGSTILIERFPGDKKASLIIDDKEIIKKDLRSTLKYAKQYMRTH